MAEQSVLAKFAAFAAAREGAHFADYAALHCWSVSQPAEFWQALWDFAGIRSNTPATTAIQPGATMAETRWFPGATVNFVQQVFRHVDAGDAAGQPAIIAEDERGARQVLGWRALRRQVASLACELQRLGIGAGDRVAAYLPNRTEATIAFLATAAIGAIWTVCGPDMGADSILKRFAQVEPKLLFATDASQYGGRAHDHGATVAELIAALPTLAHVVLVATGRSETEFPDALAFAPLTARTDTEVQQFEPLWLPFDHPLWILYSSGTTGKPKAIVHSHGGIILGMAAMALHLDTRSCYAKRPHPERFFWFSSTAWMMWNVQVGALLDGATICLFDGSAAGADRDWATLWRFVARNQITIFGAGAAFYTTCVRAGVDLGAVGNLQALRAVGSTASPLPAATQEAVTAQLVAAGAPAPFWLNVSGGTDICGTFCTANRDLPQMPGRLQCRQLGAAVESWSPDGKPLVGEVGELVCTKAMPSMPLCFWGDADGRRYRAAYFETFPGIWRHGDWLRINADGSCEIFGRSDATINRGGHRMGTSEIYDAVATVAAVQDSLAVDVRTGDSSQLLLFLCTDAADQPAIADAARAAIRQHLSPRFVPDRVFCVGAVPRTISGKRQELPVKRLFETGSLSGAIDRAAMANPDCLAEYEQLAAEFRAQQGAQPAR